MADFSATLRSPSTAVLRVGASADAAPTLQRGRISPLLYKMIADRYGGGAPVVWVVQGFSDTAGTYAGAAIVAGTARVEAVCGG